MFLTDKHRQVVPVFPAPTQHQLPALSSRLLSLLPLPQAPHDELSWPWLSRACHLLSLTVSDAAPLLLHSCNSLHSAPLLDSTTLTLLHSCNSLSAFCQALLQRLLFVRFSLKSHQATLFPEKKPLPELTAPRLLSFTEQPPPPPHGKIDSAQNAICAVEAVSALVIGVIWVTLSGKGAEHLEGLKVTDADQIFAWGKDFNKLLEAVSKRIQEEGSHSVAAQLEMMETVLANGGRMEKSRMEALCEEMREGLEKLNASINALFQAALCARNAALHTLSITIC